MAAMPAPPITRNLTSTFMRYRHERRGSMRRDSGGSATPPGHRLLDGHDGDPRGRGEFGIEMASLPPAWIDLSEEAQEDLKNIREKLNKLMSAQQKRLLRVFDNDAQPDKDVEAMSASISSLVRKCEQSIHQVKTRGIDMNTTDADMEFRVNVQRHLATQLQKLSQQFRKAQKDYMSDVQKRSQPLWDDGPNAGGSKGSSVDLGFSDSQLLEMDAMEVNASQRSAEICQIASSINDLHTIFKELAVLVIDQGTILDRIDYNIEQVVTTSKDANEQLKKAEKSQKSNRATKCMLLLVAINVILILILIFKSRH